MPPLVAKNATLGGKKCHPWWHFLGLAVFPGGVSAVSHESTNNKTNKQTTFERTYHHQASQYHTVGYHQHTRHDTREAGNRQSIKQTNKQTSNEQRKQQKPMTTRTKKRAVEGSCKSGSSSSNDKDKDGDTLLPKGSYQCACRHHRFGVAFKVCLKV